MRDAALGDQAAAIAWFTAEHPGLLAAQRTAAQRGWHQSVWQLAWSLNAFHRRQGHLHDDLRAWQAGLSASRASNDQVAHIWAHRFLTHACARTAKHAEAFAHIQASLTTLEDDEACTYTGTRDAFWPAQAQPAELELALEAGIQVLQFYRTTQDPLWEADILDAIGYVCALLGRHDKAHSSCESALSLFRRHHDRIGEAAALDTLGFIAHKSSRHIQALDYFHQALTLRRDIRDSYGEADTLRRFGEVFLDTGQLTEACYA